MAKEEETELGTGLAVFKTLAEAASKDSVFTQLAEASGLTHYARARKAASLAKILDAYNLPKNDPDIVLSMVEQVTGISPAAIDRMRTSIEKRQARLESSIEEVASQHEAESPGVPLGKVEEEKLEAWCDHVMTISDEEMRGTWARLLRLEASNSGSFSLRGMDALRLFSKQDATLLQIIAAQTIVAGGDLAFVLNIEYSERLPKIFAMLATSINLIAPSQFSSYDIGPDDSGDHKLLRLRDGTSFIARATRDVPWKIPFTLLTPLGRELVKLPTVPTSDVCVQALAEHARESGWTLERV